MEIDECQSNPCKNNGTCIDLIGSFNCTCVTGFNGTQCENNIDDCPSHGCNNGTCIDGINNYTCDCNPGFSGLSCEIDINECEGKLIFTTNKMSADCCVFKFIWYIVDRA